jgi:taurine--2-oxoglutarate transaminase
MLVPYNASGADAAPMQELLGACRERGVWPFTHFNRLHVTPPLTTSLADLELGLARIDDALTVVDRYATD